jgi:hypothetical protein
MAVVHALFLAGRLRLAVGLREDSENWESDERISHWQLDPTLILVRFIAAGQTVWSVRGRTRNPTD